MLKETFEFERVDETSLLFRLMVKFNDENGDECKCYIGDGVLKIADLVSWTGSSDEFEVKLYIAQDGDEAANTGVISTVVTWIPEEMEDQYVPPEFDEDQPFDDPKEF